MFRFANIYGQTNPRLQRIKLDQLPHIEQERLLSHFTSYHRVISISKSLVFTRIYAPPHEDDLIRNQSMPRYNKSNMNTSLITYLFPNK